MSSKTFIVGASWCSHSQEIQGTDGTYSGLHKNDDGVDLANISYVDCTATHADGTDEKDVCEWVKNSANGLIGYPSFVNKTGNNDKAFVTKDGTKHLHKATKATICALDATGNAGLTALRGHIGCS